MCIYLYIKTHKKTGLKYLGKTKRNPYTYNGSGIDWKQHLKEYGNDIDTQILVECKNQTELSYWGRYYSTLWDIANSTDWANRIPETGGGTASPSAGLHMRSEENKKRMREHNPAKSIEARQKISQKTKGVPKSEKHKQNMCKPMQIHEVAARRRGSGNWNYDNRIFQFEHKDGRQEICTQWQLRTKYNLNKGNLTTLINQPDKKKYVSGWRMITQLLKE